MLYKNLPLPYPQRQVRRNTDKQFEKFLEMIRDFNVSIPFLEAIKSIPAYAKFLKDILANKRDVTLPKGSIIAHLESQPKLKDPGSFTIPVNWKTPRLIKPFVT